MYTNASEASKVFGKLRLYLFSFFNRGHNKEGHYCLKSLVNKEKF